MVITTQIDADVLCGATTIYFLIGVAWAMTYWIILKLRPTASPLRRGDRGVEAAMHYKKATAS